jgi:hypothetical protein
MDAIRNEQQYGIGMLDPYVNPYQNGLCDNRNAISDNRMLTQSLARSINEKRDIVVKMRSERLDI